MDTQDLIQTGERLYAELKEQLEREHLGKFVAIDVHSKEHFIGDSVDAVLDEAMKKKPEGFFHIVHIGSGSVYRLTSVVTDASRWRF